MYYALEKEAEALVPTGSPELLKERVSTIAATDAVASAPAETSSELGVDCAWERGTCSGGFKMSHMTVL